MSAEGAGAGAPVAAVATAAVANNLQKVYNLIPTNKAMDESANGLLKDFITFFEKYKTVNTDSDFKTLIITVGLAKHDSPNTQLIQLLELLTQKNYSEDKVILHFDSEWDKQSSRTNTTLKKHRNMRAVSDFYSTYSQLYSNNTGSLHKDAHPSYRKDINYYFNSPNNVNDVIQQMNSKTISQERLNILEHNVYDTLSALTLFLPYNLVSYYEGDAPAERYLFAKNKKLFADFGKGCPPVPGSTYETLQQFIQKEKFTKIIIYNAAYWDAKVVVKNNKGQNIGIKSILQNRYFEGMCELLYIVLNAGDSVEKYIFDTEFQRKLGRQAYTHKNAEKIISIIRGNYGYPAIGILYPLNETTGFAGGKRKTRKQKKRL